MYVLVALVACLPSCRLRAGPDDSLRGVAPWLVLWEDEHS